MKKIRSFKLTEKQLRLGAKELLEREKIRIINVYDKRKTLQSDSDQFNKLTFELKTLINSHNRVADLWRMERF